MMSTALVRRTAISILCLLALWKSWESFALFSDGASFFIETVHRGWFQNYNERAREYTIAASQVPLLIGLWFGIDDLHQLSRLYSFGTLALPTSLYVLAIIRAKDDPILLSAVLAAISLVFLTTSYFIVGEYNTAYAIAIAAAATIAAADRPRPVDGIVLLALAVLALRTYEIFLFLGPLLAAMTMWAAYRQSSQIDFPFWWRKAERLLLMGLPVAAALFALAGLYALPLVAGAVILSAAIAGWRWPSGRNAQAFLLYLLSAALFFASPIVAVGSMSRTGWLNGVRPSTALVLHNIQFDLVVAAAVVFCAWSLLRPSDLMKRYVFIAAALPLVPLAMLPIAQSSGLLFRPLGTLHYPARIHGVVIVAAIVCFIWTRKSGGLRALPLFTALDTPAVARRCLNLFFLMFLAILPSELFIATEWTSFLDTVRKTVRTHSGVVSFEQAPAEIARFYWCCGDPDFIAQLSLALRSRPEGAIIVADGTQPLPLLPDLGRYSWRD